MAQPTWITPAGNLGVIPEGVFYQLTLAAVDAAAGISQTFVITTVPNPAGPGAIYQVNGVSRPELVFVRGRVYTFVQSAASNTNHPIAFRDSTGASYTTGVVTTGVPGQPGAATVITVAADAPENLRYYCTVHGNGMGNTITVQDGGVTFAVIAGSLPDGIQLNASGAIVGVPVAAVRLQGVPLDVSRDVTSKFTIRALSQDVPSRVRDRTFEITITGDDVPEFTTPAGSLGTFYDGDRLDIQIGYTDTDPADTVIVQFVGGELPRGITVSKSGLISGHIVPEVNVTEPPGYDLTPVSTLPYDFLVSAISKNYQFTLEVTDSRNSNLRTFEFFVYDRGAITADNTTIISDNTIVTADQTTERRPFIINTEPSDLGIVRGDNYYAYQFIGNDFDTPSLRYAIGANQDAGLPPGLELDSVTGWYYGYLPEQGITEVGYSFNIVTYQDEFVGTPLVCTATQAGTNRIVCASTAQIRSGQPIVFTGTAFGEIVAVPNKVYYVLTVVNTTEFTVSESPDKTAAAVLTTAAGNMNANLIVASDPYPYSIIISGDIDAEVTWLTSSNLGTVDNGDISLLRVSAVNRGQRELFYRLRSGAFNELPQGLELLPTGEISGQVSFNTFAVDLGATTFDQNTVWDSQFTFTVNAYAPDPEQMVDVVSVFKTFTVRVRRFYNRPYQNLKIQAMPPVNDREFIAELLDNPEIFVPDYIFRPTDPYFGKASRVVYQHAFGLEPDTQDRYVESLYLNHYWKNLVLGAIETAQALDADGNVVYEVVYSRVIDNLVNDADQSVGKIVNLAYPITDQFDQNVLQVYPNSLNNMRNQVIDIVGQISTKLPLWMTSKQANGRVLGFTPAWVMCYVKPGRARQVAYYIATQFGTQLNLVDFNVDRYIIDAEMSRNWNAATQRWTPTATLTTFDRFITGDSTFIGTVDIATDLAYSDVNNRTLNYIRALGGLDGQVEMINGDTLIFVKQQDYNGPPGSNYADPNNAWQDYLHPYDQGLFDQGASSPPPTVPPAPNFSEQPFDAALTISSGDESSLNDRMAIYTITVDPITEIVKLTLTTPTEPEDFVQITRGSFYRTVQLRHPTVPAAGLTQISWLPLETVREEETFFDNGSVAFTEPVDMYDPTNADDKYLVFPKANILA